MLLISQSKKACNITDFINREIKEIVFPDLYLKRKTIYILEQKRFTYGYVFHHASSPCYSHLGLKTRFEVIFEPTCETSLKRIA